MINLRQVEVFYAVIRTGSVTQAARLLNVTQPAVSIALKQLESRLKLKLFERSGGRLQATAEARALIPDLTEIFQRLAAVERLSQDLAQGARGSFSVAATPPLCDGFVANCVAGFLRTRPDVRISIQGVASLTVVDRVISGEADLGVVYEPVVSAAVQVEEIARARIGCVLPARHRLARRAAVSSNDLAGERVITYLPQALLRPYIDRVLGAGDASLTLQVLTGNSSTAIALAIEGAGIALVESALFLARPHRGFVLRPLTPATELKVLLLRPRPAARSRLIDDFLHQLRATFAGGTGA
jgi:DNA-binding transcriptional LysR family regulator